MLKEPLGRSGIKVSRLGLGGNTFGWLLDVDGTRRVVDAALDAGVNFIDTADMYGRTGPKLPAVRAGARGDSERFLGQVLAGRRDRVVVATKFGNDMGDGETLRGSPAYVRRAVDASLARLRMDYVDVLYYHRPDGVTPLAETVGAMEELVRDGKVRALGCSNLSVAELREVGTKLSALQNRHNLLERADAAEVIPACAELGVAYIPFSPLAGGLLSGKYRRDGPAEGRLAATDLGDVDYDRLESLERFARDRGHDLLELAIAWLASDPAIPAVIAGATSPEQVRANAAGAGWQLSAEERAAI
jgi:aryl-alcohol dehydrogenase-like predicted oxidoreductase